MATTFVRAGHLHTAGRILSASTEAGLMVGAPLPSTANKGQLRLRATGVPTAATALDVLHKTGGNPYGYATSQIGQGAGAAVVWKSSTDAVTDYRGYIDTPYLVRVEYPVPYSASANGYPSTPRSLPGGDLGFIISGGIGTNPHTFYRMTTAGVVTPVVIDTLITGTITRPELVVMPSGRLLAFLNTTFGAGSIIQSYWSDDLGTTWTLLNDYAYVNTAKDSDCLLLEYVDDMITGIFADPTGSNVTDVIVSRDGGCTFTLVDDTATVGTRPGLCLTAQGKLLASGHSGAAELAYVRSISPGGGFGQAIDVGGAAEHEQPILCRDDGVLWMWKFDPSGIDSLAADISCSLDSGLTWSDQASAPVINSLFDGLTNPYEGVSVGMWGAKAIMLAHTMSDQGAGTNHQIHMLTWGEWANVTDIERTILGDGSPYEATLVPTDIPDDQGWGRADLGAGSTVTNQPWFRFVSLAGTNSLFTSPTAFYANAIEDSRRVRFRTRINSGGSVSTNLAVISMTMSDGVNEQELRVRFTTTGCRFVDTLNNTLLNITTDLTGWVDWLVAVKHDSTPGAGKATVYYKKQADVLWTATVTLDIAEGVGTRKEIAVGGSTVGAASWDLAFLDVADDDNGMAIAPVVNPTALAGRALGTVADYYLTNGIRLGARNGGAIPGDSYTITPTYAYPKEAIWRELRPSKKVHSSADGTDWNVVFDAGSGDKFKGDTIALFGTNFRSASLEFNTTDSWGAPAATVALDSKVTEFVVGAGVRGAGYVGPTSSLSWRPGQFKSDGDGHRWFLSTGTAVYEITDNDTDRIYVEGVNFSAAAGTYVILGDRMGAVTTFKQYRFMRLVVTSQQSATVDDCFHVGTLIFDSGFTPAQLYDHGFVDRVEPRVELTESDSGYRSSARIGPRRATLSIQWPPIAALGPSTDLEGRLRDFYTSIEGAHRPFVFWRDTSDITTLGLYRCLGVYQASNVWGERSTALTRVDQLVLEEEQ